MGNDWSVFRVVPIIHRHIYVDFVDVSDIQQIIYIVKTLSDF